MTVFSCEAIVRHGPGHQSRTRCSRTDEHPLDGCHKVYLTVAREMAYWTGADDAITGFFDESPMDEDEWQTAYAHEVTTAAQDEEERQALQRAQLPSAARQAEMAEAVAEAEAADAADEDDWVVTMCLTFQRRLDGPGTHVCVRDQGHGARHRCHCGKDWEGS